MTTYPYCTWLAWADGSATVRVHLSETQTRIHSAKTRRALELLVDEKYLKPSRYAAQLANETARTRSN